MQHAHNSASVRLPPFSLATINERHTAELSEARVEKRRKRDSQKSQRGYDDPYTKWDEVKRLDVVPNEPRRRNPAPSQQDVTNSHDQDQVLRPTRRSPREILQAQWDEATEQAGAAPVTIVSDDGDTTGIPAMPQGFKYLESGYAKYVINHVFYYRVLILLLLAWKSSRMPTGKMHCLAVTATGYADLLGFVIVK